MEPKPGIKTSEFWLSAASLLVSALVILHVIPAGDAQGVGAWANATVTSAVALYGSFELAKDYIASRVAAKRN